jgi:hypothetical protein
MSYKIVVARYNEDINWLNTEMNNCIIYNKGEKLNIDNEIMLDNVGRESETYLHYIITNYDNLPEVVVFTQANIEDHIGSNDVNFLIRIKNEALIHSRSQNYITHFDVGKNIHWDATWNLRNNQSGRLKSKNIVVKREYFLNDNYKNNKPITFIERYKTNINENYPDPIYIYQSGLFAIRKEHILNKPIEYYKKLILEVNHHINSTEGHFFERSWYYIFENKN